MELCKFGAGSGPVLYVCLRGVSRAAEEKLKTFMSLLGNKHIVYGTFEGYDSEQNRCIRLGGNAESQLYTRYGILFYELLDKYVDEQKIEKIVMLGCSVGSTILQWTYEFMKHKSIVAELICCAPKECVTKRPGCYLFWNEDDDKILFDLHYYKSKRQLIESKCFAYSTGGHDFPAQLFEFEFMH